MKKSMQDVLKQIIKETIAPLLKSHGFKKKSNNFAKIFPDMAWTVNIQSSKWNTKNEVDFTLNTGIFTEKLFGTFYEFELPKFPTQVNSVLRMRISQLKNTKDDWYKLTNTTDSNTLKKQIIRDIEDVIIPHFEKFQSIVDVIEEIDRKEKQGWYENPHYLTILYHSYGNEGLALNRMKKVYNECELDSQKEFITELSERMGLDISHI